MLTKTQQTDQEDTMATARGQYAGHYHSMHGSFGAVGGFHQATMRWIKEGKSP